MERLQRAIARARAERSGDIGNMPEYEPVGRSFESAGNADSQTGASSRARKSQRSTTPIDSITYTRTRMVALNPTLLEKNRVIAGIHDDRRVETYRTLRTQVLQALEQGGWSNLAMTSPHEDAGKSLTSVNLAISLSHEVNHTVLLVDLDLRKPDVHRTLGVDIDKGLVDVLRGEAKIEDVLFNPGMPRLVVLPCNPLGQHSSELLTSPAMKKLLREITQRYDSRLVIFDLPPLLRNDDAILFTPFVDATLLVVEDNKNTPEEIKHSLHLLRNVNLLGTILNKSREV